MTKGLKAKASSRFLFRQKIAKCSSLNDALDCSKPVESQCSVSFQAVNITVLHDICVLSSGDLFMLLTK